jgi:hypothetical protein
MHSYINILQDEFEKKIIERDSHEEALRGDVSSHESDNIIFLDVGGVNKKVCIYGVEMLKIVSYETYFECFLMTLNVYILRVLNNCCKFIESFFL